MSNTKLKKAARARMKRTGESYTTARMHVLKKLQASDGRDPARSASNEMMVEGSVPDVETPADGAREAAQGSSKPLFDYLCLTPDGELSGMAVLLEFPLQWPALACDTCFTFVAQYGERVPGSACKMYDCDGKMYVWLRPDLINTSR